MISILNGFEFQNQAMEPFSGMAAVVFYFTMYSFFGWIIENSYNLVTQGRFIKPNFLYGPFKPMYGFAPVLLVTLISPETNIAIVLLLCFFIPTLVEYMSGTLLQKIFQRQWWDYSKTPFQLHGHICLPFSMCWLVLSLACLRWVHPGIAAMYVAVEPLWIWLWAAVGVYFFTDFILSVRRHTNQKPIAEEPANPIQ